MRIFIVHHHRSTNGFGTRCLAFILATALAGCVTQAPAPPSETSPPSVTSPPPVPATRAPQTPVVPTGSVQVEVPLVPEAAVASFSKGAALQTWVDQEDRLYRVAAPLMVNNTELCPHHSRHLLGLTAKTKYSYSDGFVAEAHSVLGLGERLRVMSVLPTGGAALAGILKGDILLAVEIEPLSPGPDAERVAASLVGSEMQGRSSLDLTVSRGGQRMAMRVPLTLACAMVIDLGNTGNVNSYADGYRVMITRGMLNFVHSDEELAYVLAKEIAHNVLTPSTRADMGAVIDRLRTLSTSMAADDLAANIAPYSPVLDATADKLALYLLVRAGYSIDKALDFWKRLAAAYPAEIKNSYTALHPSTAYRLSVMTQIVQAIRMKIQNNLPLIP